MKIVVGIDCDAIRHGYAVYFDGVLTVCATANTVEIVTQHLPALLAQGEVIFSIENVLANNFCYAMKFPPGLSAASKEKTKQDRMRKVGRNQQAQAELMAWLDRYTIPYILHKPQAGNWADNKGLFEKVTGWKGRSNEDSRSASYFGYLATGGKRAAGATAQPIRRAIDTADSEQ